MAKKHALGVSERLMESDIEKRGGKRPGAGRPRVENPKKTKCLKLSLEARNKIVELSNKSGLSQAEVVEHCVSRVKSIR